MLVSALKPLNSSLQCLLQWADNTLHSQSLQLSAVDSVETNYMLEHHCSVFIKKQNGSKTFNEGGTETAHGKEDARLDFM